MPRKPPSAPQTGAPRNEPQDYLHALRLDKLPELIPPSQVAERLNISRQTIYVLVQTGELSGIQFNKNALRIFKRSLIDYIQRRLV
jgi:excisionase family DNA binding protein